MINNKEDLDHETNKKFIINNRYNKAIEKISRNNSNINHNNIINNNSNNNIDDTRRSNSLDRFKDNNYSVFSNKNNNKSDKIKNTDRELKRISSNDPRMKSVERLIAYAGPSKSESGKFKI